MSLKPFIDKLKKKDMVKRIKKTSLRYEAASYELNNTDTIYFENNEADKPVVSNVLNSIKKIALAFDCNPEDVYSKFLQAVEHPTTVTPDKWTSYVKLNKLEELPIITHFEKDLGPYITSSIILAKTPDGAKTNASVHRIRSLGGNRGVVRMVEGRHLHTIFNMQQANPLNVAVLIGVHPAVELAAAYQAPWTTNELEIAQTLMNGKLEATVTPRYGFVVPRADYIIEGKILKDKKEDDMMTEILGNYDHKRKQPVLQVEDIWANPEGIYWDILPGGLEHKWLMGFPVEAKLNKAVKDTVPNTQKVILTEGGSKWLHAVIQIRKKLEGEPKNAILAAFGAHPSLKAVIVVDEDIDPNNSLQVEYAMATRFQATEDMIIIKGAKGSSLDPSSDQDRLLTDKIGLDATRPLHTKAENFELAKIPLKMKPN